MSDCEVYYDGKKLLVHDFTITRTMEGVQPEIYVKCSMPCEDLDWTHGIDIDNIRYEGVNSITVHDVNISEQAKELVEEIINRKEVETMGCEDKCSAEDRGSLAKRVKDLKLTEEDRLLRKYHVVYDEGTVTNQGKDLLFELLLEDYKETIVEKLTALEEADTEE